MDGLQGAVLNVKLKHLQAWNDARRKNANRYNELLSEKDDLIKPFEEYYAKHVYHLYVVRAKNRDKIISSLVSENIFCGIHYPIPVHFQWAYNSLGVAEGSCPIAERCAAEHISLPMFPELTEDQQKLVKEKLVEYF
jgi:dTDP-4-amino-4,6-dideoxygalactose transaminase